ncbi:D-aminoacyl-tRNA deacylase [Candidatus Bathyarchaeota archaeon]|nr:D-aminoacyl-tRNA deacylase [Candidatus Bathyarchaeota archaeon]
MPKGITLSLADPAGETMLGIFRERGFKEKEKKILTKDDKIIIVKDKLIVPAEQFIKNLTPQPYPDDYTRIATEHKLEYIVVASRHWAASGRPSLTAHPTGNFGKAMYGGNPKELQMTAPNPMRNIYMKILESPPEGFQVSLEATHHSPTEFDVPMFFVEIGSREEQWRDDSVAEYLVDCILKGMDSKEEAPIAIGFGEGHYCPKFSEHIQDYAMGHMAAKYAIELLNENLIHQMVEKSQGIDKVFLDKGLKGKHKRIVLGLLESAGIEVE